MKIFAPNRKNSSCQEMVGQYLRCCSMGKLVLGTGYWVCRLIVRNHSENKGEVKGNRLKNVFHRKTAPEPSAGLPRLFTGSYGAGGAGSG